ncbi:MAG: hypothetical protein Q9221_004662 [Calogaya cf. arnoldii]
MTHLKYATNSEGKDPKDDKRAFDYAYARQPCRDLRDGKHHNELLCGKDHPCDSKLSFRNADTLAFVAAGIYWEAQCGKEIDIEIGGLDALILEDPIWNDDEGVGPEPDQRLEEQEADTLTPPAVK